MDFGKGTEKETEKETGKEIGKEIREEIGKGIEDEFEMKDRRYRSSTLTNGLGRSGQRALLYATGMDEEDMNCSGYRLLQRDGAGACASSGTGGLCEAGYHRSGRSAKAVGNHCNL